MKRNNSFTGPRALVNTFPADALPVNGSATLQTAITDWLQRKKANLSPREINKTCSIPKTAKNEVRQRIPKSSNGKVITSRKKPLTTIVAQLAGSIQCSEPSPSLQTYPGILQTFLAPSDLVSFSSSHQLRGEEVSISEITPDISMVDRFKRLGTVIEREVGPQNNSLKLVEEMRITTDGEITPDISMVDRLKKPGTVIEREVDPQNRLKRLGTVKKVCKPSPPPPSKKIDLYHCLYCNETFLNCKTRRNHILSNHSYVGRNHSCVFCNRDGFPTIVSLFLHLLNDHQTVYFACEICKERFINLEELKAHVGKRHNLDVIRKLHSSLSERVSTLKQEKDYYSCDTCQRKFLVESSFKEHICFPEKQEKRKPKLQKIKKKVDPLSERLEKSSNRRKNCGAPSPNASTRTFLNFSAGFPASSEILMDHSGAETPITSFGQLKKEKKEGVHFPHELIGNAASLSKTRRGVGKSGGNISSSVGNQWGGGTGGYQGGQQGRQQWSAGGGGQPSVWQVPQQNHQWGTGVGYQQPQPQQQQQQQWKGYNQRGYNQHGSGGGGYGSNTAANQQSYNQQGYGTGSGGGGGNWQQQGNYGGASGPGGNGQEQPWGQEILQVVDFQMANFRDENFTKNDLHLQIQRERWGRSGGNISSSDGNQRGGGTGGYQGGQHGRQQWSAGGGGQPSVWQVPQQNHQWGTGGGYQQPQLQQQQQQQWKGYNQRGYNQHGSGVGGYGSNTAANQQSYNQQGYDTGSGGGGSWQQHGNYGGASGTSGNGQEQPWGQQNWQN